MSIKTKRSFIFHSGLNHRFKYPCLGALIIGSCEAGFPEDMEFTSLFCQSTGPVVLEASGIRNASLCAQMYSDAF